MTCRMSLRGMLPLIAECTCGANRRCGSTHAKYCTWYPAARRRFCAKTAPRKCGSKLLSRTSLAARGGNAQLRVSSLPVRRNRRTPAPKEYANERINVLLVDYRSSAACACTSGDTRACRRRRPNVPYARLGQAGRIDRTLRRTTATECRRSCYISGKSGRCHSAAWRPRHRHIAEARACFWPACTDASTGGASHPRSSVLSCSARRTAISISTRRIDTLSTLMPNGTPRSRQ
jgi:hypothetical protein